MTAATFWNKEEMTVNRAASPVVPNSQRNHWSKLQMGLGSYQVDRGRRSHFLALERELIEELGFTATIGEYYGQAVRVLYPVTATICYNPAYIYEVTDL